MLAWAPRLLFRARRGSARGVLLAASLVGTVAGTGVEAQSVVGATYADPTDRYPHAVLGDAIEWGTLELTLADGQVARITLPQDHVFEDVAPRLVDLDRDGDNEVLVVEADLAAGAALAVYDERGKVTETPHIGTRFRWLAPLGAADLGGDGVVEIAYIDRPHLAKTLRLWSYEDRRLTQVGSRAGLTNHRIGEPDIAGGIRECGAGPEMILATANWSELVALTWDGTGFERRVLGTDTTRPAFAAAMACQ